MYGDTLIQDVLSFLPDWGLKEDHLDEKPLKDYENSHVEPFLGISEENKAQLYTAKKLTKREIMNEFKYTEQYVKQYTHRERLPRDEELYIAMCKYTAGSLFLKYTQSTEQKPHGMDIRQSAMALIEPYVKLEPHGVSRGPRRRVDVPKWFLDMGGIPRDWDNRIHHPHRMWSPRHRRGVLQALKKPYIIIETNRSQCDITIFTKRKPRMYALIKTVCSKKRCRCVPWHGWR